MAVCLLPYTTSDVRINAMRWRISHCGRTQSRLQREREREREIEKERERERAIYVESGVYYVVYTLCCHSGKEGEREMERPRLSQEP